MDSRTDASSTPFRGCVAEWRDGVLTIGNACIERRWSVDAQGRLTALSLTDRVAGASWMARPSRGPVMLPPWPVPDEPRSMSFRRAFGQSRPVEEPSLFVELTAQGRCCTLIYEFQIFPDIAGMMHRLRVRREAPAPLTASPEQQASTMPASGVESALSAGTGASPRLDVMDQFDLPPRHVRLTHARLVDQSDVHNELVHEDQWLLHPNEREVSLTGNLFAFDDPTTGLGLVLVKHAPLPGARPVPGACDLLVEGTPACWYGGTENFSPEHPDYPPCYRATLRGQGIAEDATDAEGLAWAVVLHEGGAAGRTLALHRWQRALRRYDPSRDGLLLSNTWGDRSQDSRIEHAFLEREIDAAGAMGVDIVQIDDGWQKGRTANSAVTRSTVWEGFYAADPDFWTHDPARLPHGLKPLIQRARDKGMAFGLWFGPDSSNDFANWRRDAQTLLALHRELGVRYFKIDGVKAPTVLAQQRLRALFDQVLRETGGKVTFDLDVTAQIRPGYLGMVDVGPVFVENRYTDFRRYWPHQTLRNLWKLSRWLDPVRLRMEFLNPARHTRLYEGDPLAPAQYPPAYLFATVMFSSPLGWFEVSNLPDEFAHRTAELVAVWKQHRAAMFGGRIVPIGREPDGTAWTGFVSAGAQDRGGYLLLFREFNHRPDWTANLPVLLDGTYDCKVLAGEGMATLRRGRVEATIDSPQRFLFAQLVRRP